MKQYLQLIDYALWYSIIALQCLVAVVSIRRALVKSLPRYLTFILFVSIKSLCMLAISQLLSYPFYFWSFFVALGIETALLAPVLYEIFLSAFAPRDSLPALTTARVGTSVVVLASVILAWAIWNPASHPKYPWYADLMATFHRSAGVVVACSLWTVVMYARRLGIPWRSRVAGIARGYLIYLSVQAITVTAIGFSTPAAGFWFSRIGMAGYIAALLLWTRAVRQQEIPVVLPAPESLARLQVVVAQMRAGVGRLRKPRAAAQGLSPSQE